MKYTLDIISKCAKHNGKTLRKHAVDGHDTVGAISGEEFEIHFRNNTGSPVQAKISIDGVDILSGGLADTSTKGTMWYVRPFESLKLQAYPETNLSGAAFRFTTADKSVAMGTTGDLSSRGIIAAAVFTEGQKPQSRRDRGIGGSSASDRFYNTEYGFGVFTFSSGTKHLSDHNDTLGGVRLNNINESNIGNVAPSAGLGFDYGSSVETQSLSLNANRELVAVGAGQQVEQKIETVAGLTFPVLSAQVQVRYLWWSELKEKLASEISGRDPNGFPGDSKPKKIMSLGTTPKPAEKVRRTHPSTTEVSPSRTV